MEIKILLENTAMCEGFKCAHGLSLYIETKKHKILFDMGPNEWFAENARAMGIDLKEIDIAFLSHGHNDHSGGLQHFLKCNLKAPVYLQRKAFEPHYVSGESGFRYIGLDPVLNKDRDRFVLVEQELVIDHELRLFTQMPTRDYVTDASKALRVKQANGVYEYDAFEHEQNLIIVSGEKAVLIAGCAHKGIINILRGAELILGKAPDYVFGGFHLFDPFSGKTEPAGLIQEIGEEMKKRETRYYTGHCTGMTAYEQLKAVLEDQVTYMGTGASFTI